MQHPAIFFKIVDFLLAVCTPKKLFTKYLKYSSIFLISVDLKTGSCCTMIYILVYYSVIVK
jgi:hypothetical protein